MPSIFSKAVLFGAVLSSALAIPLDQELVARQNGGRVLVPGIAVSGNNIPQRLEIREFVRDRTRLNLFLLALERLQSQDRSNPLSWYAISGIHGTNQRFDNDDGGRWGTQWGYCRHQDALFPTWHRPYLSLYEKTLYDMAAAIVNEFPAGTERTAHQAALQSFRIPYWDWAVNAALPQEIGGADSTGAMNIQVTKPRVGNVMIRNPLYSYRFPTANDPNARVINTAISNDRTNTIETVRNPVARNGNYVSRGQYTTDEMVEIGTNLKNDVYRMFSNSRTYNSMASMAGSGSSLERVHGTVHITVGGLQDQNEIEGHMTDPMIAGFDPIFYLHHTNVDRLFAMWQALYPNSYVDTASANRNLNEDSQLHPFRRTATTYWTSKASRDIKVFGYTYPELASNPSSQQMQQIINGLYGNASPARAVAEAAGKPVFKRQENNDDKLHTPANPAELEDKVPAITNGTNTYNEFVAKISAPNDAANGSYKLSIFFGEAEEKGTPKADNFVGSFDIFARNDLSGHHIKNVLGDVQLTNALLTLVGKEQLSNMKPDTVRDYLKKNFKLVGTGADGSKVDTTNIKCDVITQKVTIPAGSTLPTWGEEHKIYSAQAVAK